MVEVAPSKRLNLLQILKNKGGGGEKCQKE
jgi:hypothetical protein